MITMYELRDRRYKIAENRLVSLQAQSWPGGAQVAGVLLVVVGIPLGATATTRHPADSADSPSTSEEQALLVTAGATAQTQPSADS